MWTGPDGPIRDAFNMSQDGLEMLNYWALKNYLKNSLLPFDIDHVLGLKKGPIL